MTMVLTPGPPSSSQEPSTTCLVAMKMKYNTGVLYLPRGYDFSVITSFLMYLITALYNINQSYKDVSENIEKKMRISFKNEFCFRELGRTTFLEAVRPLVSTLAEQVCLNCVMPSVTRLWILWTDSTFSMISSASSLLAEPSL